MADNAVKPNLLFIYTDEQRADTLAAYGNSRISMPNLDRLARRSTVFERAYVSQPVCTPSRSTLLTGLTPHTNGCVTNNVPLHSGTPCLPEMLPDGYATGHFGKWHLGDEIFAQHGFSEWRSIEDMYSKYYTEGHSREERSTYHRWLLERGQSPDPKNGIFSRNAAARLPEELSKPRYLALEASRFIRENEEQPFCLYVNFLEPHMPFTGCRDDQYDPYVIELPSNFDDLNYISLREEAGASRFALRYRTEADWRALTARYWGLCSLVDTWVGEILNTLAACGLDDRTVVVFTSDHGDMMGSHRLLTKGFAREEAVRVPFMVSLPGQSEQRRISNSVSQLDVVPTLLDLMNVPAPRGLEGESLGGCCRRGLEPERDVVIEWQGAAGSAALEDPNVWAELAADFDVEAVRASATDPFRAIVTPDRWKLVCSPLGEHALFDLNSDPHETRNVFSEPANKTRIADMRRRLGVWRERTRDEVELPAVGQ